MVDRESLAKRVEPLDEQFANMIRSDDAEVERLETPFFERGAIYRVAYLGRHHPVGFAVGTAEPDFTALLAVDPGAFMRLADEAGVRLGSAGERISYVVTFLETTRDFARRFQILRSFEEIELVPSATPAEEHRYEQLRRRYDSAIKGPEATGDGPWEVIVFALKAQDLVRYEIGLDADGKMRVAESTLEKNMPIALVR